MGGRCLREFLDTPVYEGTSPHVAPLSTKAPRSPRKSVLEDTESVRQDKGRARRVGWHSASDTRARPTIPTSFQASSTPQPLG